ncbi:glycosyltransferase [Primorskyibacter aestuariivivens]|uniref:glycosyltransferase family 2 protein n=1 Tax=Primorskyibacter aestuariivivens TaxID=1888912 RepID=UPI0022FFC64C|nr:glycosyltransferase family 2 protein [Primorskyibacter aestuariivivens]MDA7430553.1 glycosyltransferase [Primorskyibacter aestuariivivens]
MPDVTLRHGQGRRHRADSRFTRRLFSGWRRVKYEALILLWIAASLYFWVWWFQPEHILPGARYWIVTLAFGWLFFMQAYFVFIFRTARVPACAAPSPDTTRVAMIVTKTPSEPFSVLKRTLEAMLAQSYPHDTWLADEDPQPETIAWCEERGIRISTRKNRPDYHRSEWPRRTRCKEGNLAFFYDMFGYEMYDVVSQLDADHVPSPTYLEEIMKGFADPEVGYVSAPSICANNADESWAARTRLHTEAGFHGVFQTGYASSLAPMCIGSHYAVRTCALREVGGLGPELAEDHSTTLLLNSGGWRGVHALDAIATGDGPANISDLCTQEFQWSRSLLTLLLRYTPRYLRILPTRLKFLFVFCQLWYPLFAGFMFVLYLIPILAVIFDMRYADVTYPDFVLHAIWPPIVLTIIAYALRADGYFRPRNAPVLGWEKALFLALQWPWVLWGCLMAVQDRFTGNFVDFRITPKGEAAEAVLPLRVVLPYLVLALGCIVPVLLFDQVLDARGFYFLTLLNGSIYAIISAVIVIRHLRDNNIRLKDAAARIPLQLATVPLLLGLIVYALGTRGPESLLALSVGIGNDRMVRYEYVVSGAGLGEAGAVRYRWNPDFLNTWFTFSKE